MLGLGILRGLSVTLIHFFKPKFTVRYPEQRLPLAPGYRGAPLLVLDEQNGRARCVGCGVCVRACPQGVIKLKTERLPDGARQVRSYQVEIIRCLFCGLCEDACPFGALKMSEWFELARYNRYSLEYGERFWTKASAEDAFMPPAAKGKVKAK